MANLDKLLAEKRRLEAKIEREKKADRAKVLTSVRKLCKQHGFTYNQLKNHLAPGRKSGPRKKRK